MIHTSDKRVVRLDGLCITQLVLDRRFAAVMWEAGRSLRLTIETPFQLYTENGSYTLDPNRSETLCPSLSLLHKPVDFFEANYHGECRLCFEDGTEVQVSKHETFESWEVSGSGELESVQMLCSPHAGPPWGDK